MSRRRKHVRNLVDEALPELTEGDEVCRVTELRGGNQVEVRISRASPARTAAAAGRVHRPPTRAKKKIGQGTGWQP